MYQSTPGMISLSRLDKSVMLICVAVGEGVSTFAWLVDVWVGTVIDNIGRTTVVGLGVSSVAEFTWQADRNKENSVSITMKLERKRTMLGSELNKYAEASHRLAFRAPGLCRKAF